jgi:hypothetical protein
VVVVCAERLGSNTDGDATPFIRRPQIADFVACDDGVDELRDGPCAIQEHAGTCP